MALPVAAIVCIVLACWVVVVFALFGLYKFLKYRGSCDCDCAPCGREGGENTCCKSLSEACNCCNPSVQGCLNSACPKKKISCVDIILCQCCAEPGQDSCLVNVLQYIFCCPCKTLSECCLVRDEDNNWVTRWMEQNQSFCQWMCSCVKCGSCGEKDCTCQLPSCKCCRCSSMIFCQNSCCSDVCCQKESLCGCLGLREQINALWLKLRDLSCCKCAKDDKNILCCKCCNEKFLKCSSDSCSFCKWSSEKLPCSNCNSDNCRLNNCLMNDNNCICSQPVKCPTYEIEVSTRMKGLTVCPFCPENILCFTCNETEAIRCCCHYVFLNRCGDPDFIYEDPKEEICVCNESSCCTFLFELFAWSCQFFCVGCFTVLENSVKCCGYSCFSSIQLLTCQCSNVDFCSKFSFLCFDCNKLEQCSDDMGKNESEMTKCGCCIFKHEPVQSAMEVVAQPSNEYGPEQDRMYTLPGGNLLSESQFRQICQIVSWQNGLPLVAQSMPNFERNSEQSRRAHRTRSLPNRHRFSRSENASYHRMDEDNKQNAMSHPETSRQSARQSMHKDYSSDEGYDLEDESYQDVRNIEKHQRQLLSNNYYHEEETESDVGKSIASRHGKRDSMRITSSYVSQVKASKLNDPSSRSGILKTHSKYYDDYDSNDNSENGESVREMKHAHFEDEDPELYRELFPRQQRIDDERPTLRQMAHTRRHNNRRKKMVKQRHVDSDESDVADEHKTRRRKVPRRDPSSSDEDTYLGAQASSYGTNRSRHDRLNISDRQAHVIDQNRRRRNLSRDRFEISNELQDDIESDVETPSFKYTSKKNNRSRKKKDRSPRHSSRTDTSVLRNEAEEATDNIDVGRTSIHKMETNAKKKSVADRMKRMRERNQSDSSESLQSSAWV